MVNMQLQFYYILVYMLKLYHLKVNK